jgi:hypothetical protein
MCHQPGTEPIADDELLYRRVPVSKEWYSPEKGLSPEAFDPLESDVTGISVSRAKYKSVEDAAKGKSKKGYYVAVLRAVDLRTVGIEIQPQPLPDDPGHAELPQLRYDNRTDEELLERKNRLADLPIRVEGPFLPTQNPAM